MSAQMSLASQSQILAACARNVLVRAHELHPMSTLRSRARARRSSEAIVRRLRREGDRSERSSEVREPRTVVRLLRCAAVRLTNQSL